MSKFDFRKSSSEQLSFYVYDNLRSVQDNMNSNIYYYDTLKEAIDKYKELPEEWTTAIGGSINGVSELDLIQRRMGESVLITDFKKMDFWKDDKAVGTAIDYLIAYLNVKYESNRDLFGNRPILIELERYSDNRLNNYFDDKLLNPSDPKYLISSIEEAHVLGYGWMPFKDVLKMCDDYGYANPECPNITRLNVNYRTSDGRTGQVDMSTLDFRLLKEKTERFLENKIEIGSKISVEPDDRDFTEYENWSFDELVAEKNELLNSISNERVWQQGSIDEDSVDMHEENIALMEERLEYVTALIENYEISQKAEFMIYVVAGSVKKELSKVDSKNEAVEFCESYDWEWTDENEFCWSLEFDEVLDLSKEKKEFTSLDEQIGAAELIRDAKIQKSGPEIDKDLEL